MKLTINNLSVHTSGENYNQSIVFIHGFPFDHTLWEFQIKELSDKYYCVAYDVRGLGESYVGDGQYTMEAYVDDLFSIINELSLLRPVVCGHSMGGYIALRAIEKRQDNFGGLILCNTKSEADDNAAKLKRAAGIDQINTEGLIKFVDPFVTGCFAEDTSKENEKLFLNTLFKVHKHNPVGVKGALIALLSRTDTTSFLPHIKIPALILSGSFDKICPPQLMRKLLQEIPKAEFAVIPQSGHMSVIENPECVNDLIRGFLKRNF